MTALLRHWKLGIFGLLALFAALQTWRLDSAQGNLAECKAGRKADRQSYTDAQAEAKRKAEAARLAEEARYRRQAEEADNAHEAQLADARDDAERYIAANRVRPEAAGRSPGGPGTGPESGAPRVPEGLPPDGLVAVTEADVRACTAATIYAFNAHRWANGLNADSKESHVAR